MTGRQIVLLVAAVYFLVLFITVYDGPVLGDGPPSHEHELVQP